VQLTQIFVAAFELISVKTKIAGTDHNSAPAEGANKQPMVLLFRLLSFSSRISKGSSVYGDVHQIYFGPRFF